MTTATIEITTDTRITTRLAELARQRAAIPEDGTLPLSTTRDEAAALSQQRVDLDRRIAAIHAAREACAKLGTDEAAATWLDHLNAWRATLCNELLTIKSPVRDKDTKARADGLHFSIRLIDRGLDAVTLPVVTLAPTRVGELMAAAGYAVSGEELRGPRGWLGSLPEVEQRIKALTKQRTAAQAVLAAALMIDDERAEQEAEGKALREALNSMRIKGSADGRSLVAYTKDGDVLDAADMTPLQQRAFERMDAAHRQSIERQERRG